MSKKSFLLSLLTTMMVSVLSFGIVSCGGDDDIVDPNVGQPTNPNTPVNDPEGTITLSMRNKDNGDTRLDNIYIDKENFRGASFASVGAVMGLGNVSNIPTTGWAEQMSVIAGHGYLAYGNNQFYRIYVINDIAGTSGGVIGADIKYQKPFKGVDEAIQLPQAEVTLNANAGASEELIFKNNNIVLYSVSSDQSWCRVQKCSTYDYYFLYNGVYITCDENSSSSSREATVTIKTVYDKEVKIKVTQVGKEPFINMGSENVEFTSQEQTTSVSFVTNVDVSELQITGATSWCKAEISTTNSTRSDIKFIGNNPVQATRASSGSSQSYNLKLELSENTSEDERTTNIVIKSSQSNIQGTVKVVQKGITFEVSQNLIMFDRTNSNATITITTTATSWSAKSSADWCTFTTNGNQLTIRSTASTEEREANITFPGFKQTIVVRQSKYAIGDEYHEGNIIGTVGYIACGTSIQLRYVYKLVGTAVWSLEKVSTGANDTHDGRNNMTTIKKISNWKELYPAFALCDDLNVNGVTGWYLPASFEQTLIGRQLPRVSWITGKADFWTSTETDNSNASSWSQDWFHIEEDNKEFEEQVYAIHRF